MLRENIVYLVSLSWSFIFSFVYVVGDLLNFDDYLLLIILVSSMVSDP